MRELAAATIAVAIFGIIVAALMLFPFAVLAPLLGSVLFALVILFVFLVLLVSAA